MAAQPKKDKQVKQIKIIKKDYLDSLRELIKYLANKNRNDKQLNKLVNEYSLDKNIIKRILSYNLHYPHLIYYYNKYLNNLFDFNKLDLKILLKSIAYIMDLNNINQQKNFLFIKANDLKDEMQNEIKNVIQIYLKSVYDIDCNESDLRFYYKLYRLGQISDDDLLRIDKLINNDKPVLKKLGEVSIDIPLTNIRKEKQENVNTIINSNTNITNNVTNFIEEIKSKKQSRNECQNCELKEAPIVVLDTNMTDFGNIDICFVGFNPSNSESEIRKLINKFDKNINWLITNIILCQPPNKTSIKDINQTISNCTDLLSEIVFDKFNCNLFIAIGEDSKNLFGIEESISECSGKLYEIQDIKVIPLIHPNSILKNNKYKSIFESSIKNIEKLFINEKLQVQKEQKVQKEEKPIISNKIEYVEDSNNLLFIDAVRMSNNKLMYIYTDKNGQKKYKVDNFQYPISIKSGNWDNCPIITDKIDDVCMVNDYQKLQISKKAREILRSISFIKT